jgi:hypothetical protein
MHTIIRSYTGEGADELFTEIEALQAEVRDLISGVPGFISYTAFRTHDGGTTITACDDKAGTEESSRRAAEFVRQNVSVKVASPSVTEGDAVLQF